MSPDAPNQKTQPERAFVHELNAFFHSIMHEQQDVYFIGEDILDPYGGAFKVSRGLSTSFPDRVITTPISEAGIIGIAAGMAMRGLIPVVEIMFGDFITLGFDQLVNGISKFNSMYNKQVDCPIVIRTPMGGRRGYGPTHSQSLEKFIIGIPHIQVIAPSKFHNVESVYREALLNTSPVVIIENKLLYAENVIRAESGRHKDFYITSDNAPYPTLTINMEETSQADVTLISYGGMAGICLDAVYDAFMEEELVVDLILPSLLLPLNNEVIHRSVKNSGRVLIVEEGTKSLGLGAEYGQYVTENCFDYLKKAPLRVSAPDGVIPSSKEQEALFLPQKEDIVKAIRALV